MQVRRTRACKKRTQELMNSDCVSPPTLNTVRVCASVRLLGQVLGQVLGQGRGQVLEQVLVLAQGQGQVLGRMLEANEA